MRLDKYPPHGRKPIRTVTEIAEILGVSRSVLVHALRVDGAPIKITAKSLGHNVAGKNRVFYNPAEVIKWYRNIHKETA